MNKIFVKTFGCTLNQKDTEEMVGNVNTFSDFKKIKLADAILINTCGVKEQTETKILNYLKKIKSLNISEKKIIITGCLLSINKDPMLKILPFAKYLKKEDVQRLFNKKGDSLIKKTEIIIVSNGCLGCCYYCAVKFARGRLKSRPVDEIFKEVKQKINAGTKEILLTSQDNGCYGFDINTNIVNLLNKLILIEGDFKIRLGMGNPKYFYKFKEDLVKIYKSKKLYKFIHVPIQSGSDKVLKDMNRQYTINTCKKLLNYFRKNIKNITVATDIIVGYPTETETDFNKTVKILKELKFDIVNISRYGERKNIEALRYKDLHSRIKKERSRKITVLVDNICLENNKKYLNQIKTIYINEVGKNNSLLGRTDEYKQVVVKKGRLYESTTVVISEVSNNYLLGNKINI
jgi:threonylcarbamoyladenosine tRNA methylthiotransferase CDKAL1